MSKRKRSVPTNTEQSTSSCSVYFRHDHEPPPKEKRFSIDTPDRSLNENSIKNKKKNILKSLPNNIVVLGDISFSIDTKEPISFDSDDVDLCILVSYYADFVEVALKISLICDKNISKVYDLLMKNEMLVKSLDNLLHPQYVWVINEAENISKGILNINIAAALEKAPILKATNVVELFFGNINENIGEKIQKCCTEEFFKEVQNIQKAELNLSDLNVQHDKLLPKLCPYQARAVRWMLNRESEESQAQKINWLTSVVKTYKSKCNKSLYYEIYSGTLSLQHYNFFSLPKGGILADEMGLGKTVTVISLILNHPCTIEENGDYLLPHTETQKITIQCTSSVGDLEIIAKNRENCLDVDEKLYYNKVSRGPALKQALKEWYETKLSAYSTVTPSKRRERMSNKVKCICGNVNHRKKEECVQCSNCKIFQHTKCVGYKKNFLYFCPPCWTKQKLVKSNATLIIAPTSIYDQWFDEIQKHVVANGFENGVFMYDGLKNGFIQPSVLSAYDIVITTYAILRAEINFAVLNESNRKLRNEERFLKMSSPLTQILWWRLCLDEAQMVENDYSQLNQMANLINCINRWSVTGTPIQKSITDLYYLTEWLKVQPFSEKVFWNNYLYLPYIHGNRVPLCSTMSHIFWRNSKEDVADELIIPKQTVKYHFLKFTAIEQNFYMREHAISSADFSEGLKKLKLDVNRTIDSLDKPTMTRLLGPMLNLRQACSHPLAVKGNKISSKTGNITLSELLQYLFNKTKIECEEAMRRYIAALNGLAGINCINENWVQAVEFYRRVLQICEQYKEKIHIDLLQKIHTLTNLAEILETHPEGISPTLHDDSLKTDAEALEDKYMQKVLAELSSDENQLTELSTKVSELDKKFESASDVWWNHLINMLTIDGSIEEILNRISTELTTSEVENRKNVELFLSKISSVKGIEIILQNWWGGIEENREKALKQLETLRQSPCQDLVYNAVDCHLRTGLEIKKKKCKLCICESVLLDYECALFDVSRKVLKQQYEKVLDGAQTKGSWRAPNAEKCLKVLLNLSKSKSICEQWCLKDGRIHIQMLEAMKKEFKQLRAVWMSINHQIQAFDEISMCKFRLRLRYPGEPLPPKRTNLSLTEQNKIETIYIIERYEVEPQTQKMADEVEIYRSEFNKKYGTLMYLKNLGQKENPNPEPCPVCKSVLDNEWCVLQCGHSYCLDCTRNLLDRCPKKSLSCPVCREFTKSSDLSFIDLSGKQDNTDINVIGDHSTKVDGVVRSLLELKRDDPNVKVLIFSTWAVVLKILEVALKQNEISYRCMPGHKYQVHLKQFRDPNLNITALLLPISWGSKGLNLIEASHVFLIEPIMNPADELQAIGRVHRIGQTKETFVHRFLIRGTIEEKIHSAVSEAKDKWNRKKVTLEDLKNLFDMKNEFVS